MTASPPEQRLRTLFIYYRVATGQAQPARRAVKAMQAGLCDHHAELKAQLMRRPEEKDGMQTWMELYSHPAGVSPELEAELGRAAEALSQAWIQGPRHVEVFVPCA